MTKDKGPPFDDQLEAYVDGMLGAEESAQFESKANDGAAVRDAVEVQLKIDESLTRAHEPPPGALERALKEIDREAAHPTPQPQHVVPFYRRPLAIAAMILLSAGAIWQLFGILPFGDDRRDDYGPRPLTTADAFYRQTVQDGFKPDWVCKDDDEFASTFRKRFRQPLLLAQSTGSVSSVGLSYLNWLSGRTTALLARVDGRPVVVLVDQLRNDEAKSLPPGSGLNLFRCEIGKLVLYEVTPLSEHHVMDLFYNPDNGAAPTP